MRLSWRCTGRTILWVWGDSKRSCRIYSAVFTFSRWRATLFPSWARALSR
ncbi:unnamed protein product [Penicillium salamii]|nr:unnamed protein product [Penicillium salamii]